MSKKPAPPLASIGITAERYLHVYSDRDADAADAFGRLVG